MDKITSPGWPEPSDWARRLHDHLEAIGSVYMSCSWEVADDPEEFSGLNLKQAHACEAVTAVASALLELPNFHASKGVAVLHDVAGALNDVVMGGSPRLFEPVSPGKRGRDGISRNYIKVHVVLAVRLLVEAHDWPKGRARKEVTAKFARAGATGRKGNPLSQSTVQDWCDRAHPASADPQDVWIDREVERRLEDYRANNLWPGNLGDALIWIDTIASNPLLASKYG